MMHANTTSIPTTLKNRAPIIALIAALLAAVVVAGPTAPQAQAATSYNVNSSAGYGLAILAFNANCGDDTPHEIVVTADFNVAFGADIPYECDDDLTIRSSEGNHFTISGDTVSNVRFLDASGSGLTVRIEDLTIEDFGGNGVEYGGAIRTVGAAVEILDSTFTGNVADNGGAISTSTSAGDVGVSGGTFIDNTSDRGGAIRTFNGEIYVEHSVFDNNGASLEGGAIFTGGSGADTAAHYTSFTDNTAASGGAIFAAVDEVNVYNSAFVGNDALGGGAIGSTATTTNAVRAINTLFTENSAFVGSAVNTTGSPGDIALTFVTVVENSNSQVRATATDAAIGSYATVYHSTSGTNCDSDTYSNFGFNWSSDASCYGVDNGSDPMLGELTDNGGHALSMRPLPGSPLIDTMPTSVVTCGTLNYSDMRGIPRPQDGFCDTGAVELFTEFSDISDSDPAHPFMTEIAWLAGQEITGGYPDGTFRPGATVTRQAVAAFFYRAEGEPFFATPGTATFSDVPTTHPFFKEIEWLVAEGITDGYGDGTFRPTAEVSRMATAAFLYRLDGEPPYSPPATPTFSDVGTSHPFFDEIEWLNSTGITGGYSDGTFRPNSTVSRQAIAAFLFRYYNEYD